MEILQKSVGLVFEQVLERTSVFISVRKSGRDASVDFLNSVGSEESYI